MATQQLLFGIEHERFLFRNDGSPPGYQQIEAFFNELRTRDDVATDMSAHFYCVTEDTPYGRLAVKLDFCTHIIETEFPPISDPSVFLRIADSCFRRQENAAANQGLCFRSGGAIEAVPSQMCISPHRNDTDGGRARFFCELIDTGLPFFLRAFPATICATQVNLAASDGDVIPRLNRYFALEYLTPFLFSTSSVSSPLSAYCVRPLRYRASLPSSYLLVNIPSEAPENIQSYYSLRSTQVRDYSCVSPRGDHIEFRSGCSQPSSDSILMLTCLHLLKHLAAQSSLPITPRPSATVFENVCLFGRAPEQVEADLSLLSAVGCEVAPQWRPYSNRLVTQLQRRIWLSRV